RWDGEPRGGTSRQRTEARFGGALAPERLAACLRRLAKAGLRENAAAPGSARRDRRIRGSLLYLRFKVADPNRLFDRLARALRVCYTPHCCVLCATLIAGAVGTAVANWSDITQDLSRLYRLEAIPPFLAITFIAASAHEFAHGVTCKHFGGEVHELGFMLIYLQPAFYCNVSDAWLFPEKSKRLWVGFAGPYFELTLWALAVFTWRLTDVDIWANYVALIVMAGSGVKTLLNFSPLLKLDGYYLLSDYLDAPNLRRRSFRYMGNLMRRLWGGVTSPIAEVTPRERRMYLAYGLVAALPALGFPPGSQARPDGARPGRRGGRYRRVRTRPAPSRGALLHPAGAQCGRPHRDRRTGRAGVRHRRARSAGRGPRGPPLRPRPSHRS